MESPNAKIDFVFCARQLRSRAIDRTRGNRQPVQFGSGGLTGTQFDASAFPNLGRHDAEMKLHPAVTRALAISTEVAERLAAQGLAVKFSEPGTAIAAKS
jgi:hypothetical protein